MAGPVRFSLLMLHAHKRAFLLFSALFAPFPLPSLLFLHFFSELRLQWKVVAPPRGAPYHF